MEAAVGQIKIPDLLFYYLVKDLIVRRQGSFFIHTT